MSRQPRIVAAGFPHHVIQRGNRRQKVFFCDEDRKKYLVLLKKFCDFYKVHLWAYCLMDNHVHLVLVPSCPDGLAKAIGQTHWQYSKMVNMRQQWRGYLWQGRFHSFILQENYLRAVIRYVELNPVRAGITRKPECYPWSSAKTHMTRQKDNLLSEFYLLNEIKDWGEYLKIKDSPETLDLLRKHQSTGRPLSDILFLKNLSEKLGIDLLPKKPGPKPRKMVKN